MAYKSLVCHQLCISRGWIQLLVVYLHTLVNDPLSLVNFFPFNGMRITGDRKDVPMQIKRSMDPMRRLGYFVLLQALRDARKKEVDARDLEPWAALANVPMAVVRESLNQARNGQLDWRLLQHAETGWGRVN